MSGPFMFLPLHQYLKNNCGKNQTTAGLIYILRRYKLDPATKKKKKGACTMHGLASLLRAERQVLRTLQAIFLANLRILQTKSSFSFEVIPFTGERPFG